MTEVDRHETGRASEDLTPEKRAAAVTRDARIADWFYDPKDTGDAG
jgi:hypothetical protein